ncbi:MAG: ribonucleoside-diphosphate reductase subunit alpha [Candidatus Buchananbacteria bacterium RIFCSPHIGHO2_01_FULL_39_14]|uniref:Ribonucleoside-diphosphate reductase n=3 Tax=Parcubacteria group TaxID=1794811 RepID=A0A1F6XW34_9BACT|nr:MAG: ribonucleoside-diphosphate reductase subunit alpha [Candidatus Nomurabacteria bacterium RIFCSPLOWO2_02_FULL_40_10]OGY45271.1 MAG: ribonucleoside-diphosphate reductase subunit alpha [Candidatus Buchananbacteria bacterium RIFCSPHIGHO2_01_FULL_39_14]OGY48755.1 MAG: ribonucleoside-diphosphate reductase subunit alpha [Candidatus Buchananbacteria bacterium RIFCSPHIGHO2_02_FULL_39_17]OGY53528.1 MAG: ribonucleoside-diphosphate reductase subunit alpha [Candidatus Buchananbacteria bacterium RIFCSP
MITKIKKRNGEIVEFKPNKITTAIQKAYLACQAPASDGKLNEITSRAVSILEKQFTEVTPAVEDVQNAVEKILMEIGDYAVAKAYIIYRYEHTKIREEKRKDVLEKIEKNDLTVIKRNGKTEKYSNRKLKKSLSWAIKGLEKGVDLDLIVSLAEANLYEGIKTVEMAKALVMAARSLIERDPAYSKVAARLLFDSIYKDVIGWEEIDYKNFVEQYRQAFIKNLKKGVEIGRLDPRLLNFDLEAISRFLKPERDDYFMYLGGQTLADRYFISNPQTKEILEAPQAFWLRVAMGLSLAEENKIEQTEKFYDIISTLRFVPSTPTLFHAGTLHPQLSSCYLTTIDDSLDHIFKSIGDNAQLSKWSGGVANDWTNLRATGALIKGTGVESQGVIPFLKIANDTTVAINRSGRRRGATCAYLENWHIDFEDFLELRKNTGDERRRTHDMNIASWISDLFMKRVINDDNWTLFSPDETPDLHHLYGRNFEKRYFYYESLAREGKIRIFKTVRAKDLWKKMIVMLFETGHPWMTWKDPSNIRSPQDHVGVVHSSNLCTEITLNTSPEETAVCNLGSVNLVRHVIDQKFNVELLQETVKIAMRMLDNVIDINFYPTVEAKVSNLKHRPVGLGVMGFTDTLYLLGINFDSEQSVDFADFCQEVISYSAILTSAQLAGERGTYQSFRGSKWDRGILPMDTLNLLEVERGEKIPVERTARLDWQLVREEIKKHGMRNSNCMAIAPTATIANIAGCFPSIEPIYKNVYVKSNMSGEFTVINQYLVEDLKKLNLWNLTLLEEIKAADGNLQTLSKIPVNLREKYKEVFEIEPEWLIKAAAYRGKWIDQSQSLNLFVKGNSGKKISDMYLYAWSLGLKTTYYLRTLAVTSVEKSTLDLVKQQNVAATLTPTQPAIVQPYLEPKLEPQIQPLTTPLMATSAVAVNTATVAAQEETVTKLMLCKIDDPDCEACQ